MTVTETYEKLVGELKRLHRLGAIMELLGWDEQVNLPEGSAKFRGEQMSHYAALLHREVTQPRLGEWLADLEANQDALDEARRAVIREARRDYDREVKLPEAFVSRRAEARSKAYHAWAEARAKSDFKRYAPFLEEQLALAREEASYLGHEDKPYDYWIDQFDPGMDSATIERLFEELKKDLIPLVRRIIDSPVKANPDLLKGFPVERQESFLRQVIEKLGFDFKHGRLDRSLHPFCSGSAFDTRLTTRFFPDHPLDSLFSSIHETGHGLYEQGLPEAHVGTALGEAVGMAFHESQSRLWENQVARSRSFWRYWEPVYRETFQEQLKDVSSDQLYLAINDVRLNPIRVDSDEVTYNLHILLRFEIEKALFQGELAIADLPAAWNRLSQEIIGLTPKNDAEGVLQDVHWSGGAFGYFPSYCLGNMLAAQLWYAAREQLPELEEQLAKGNYGGLLDWLRNQVHQYGRLYRTPELIRKVTGKTISPEDLIRYLKERYLPLYEAA